MQKIEKYGLVLSITIMCLIKFQLWYLENFSLIPTIDLYILKIYLVI